MKIFGFILCKQSTLDRRLFESKEAGRREKMRTFLLTTGYSEWIHRAPPEDKRLIVMRADWNSPTIAKREDFSDYLNAIGTYWKIADGNTLTSRSH